MSQNVDSSSHLRGLRVLVVDDDADSRDFLMIALESYGIETRAVSSARCALNAFVELQPDVLISDLAMPDEDGYSLVQAVRALEEGTPTPAIALTALTEETHKALFYGFHRLMQKPVEIDVLINEIANLVRQNRLAV